MSKGRVSPQMYKAVSPGSSPKSSLTSSPPLPPPRAPSPPPRSIFVPPQSPVGRGKMTKGIKNREQSARASNQKRDPATGRFTQAPDCVVLRRPSAGVPDVPPGFERVTPNRTRTGGVDVKSAHHAKHTASRTKLA
jgi:hypothetical protein